MREYGVAGFAKSFVHRAPGSHHMASAQRWHVSLTVGDEPHAKASITRAGTGDARMIAWIAVHAHRSAKARWSGPQPIPGQCATHPATRARRLAVMRFHHPPSPDYRGSLCNGEEVREPRTMHSR
ncbi:hypothetical protein CFB43_23220 [Burkholderia sp. AU15512]|nr:hypothetical protein CFB43_23220 [Burkholderia sp. AU15512]